MCEPTTTNPPPPTTIVPVEVEPSCQSIEAAKFATMAEGSRMLNSAAAAENGVPAFAWIVTPEALIGSPTGVES